ncbi:hypothetical protein [Paenibacillus tengchongensis]|uniref:hypothetical protein n=1 Tax=Paenibacillus tengchongensis TaxID=2608684 RepID=UPI00124DBAEF|nr:hypothetical protein [Paenibacillus tengchongensis]
MLNQIFSYTEYTIRKKVFSIMGAKLHLYNNAEELVGYSEMKAFKLKEDIALYSDESMHQELLRIKARKMIDFSATFDVYDSESGEHVGALRRKGLKSIVKDEWIILDRHDHELGAIKEDSTLMALLRRMITLIPQRYNIVLRHQTLPAFRQNINPFVTKITADFSEDRRGELDRRLGLAAGILLCAVEGKQE